MNLLVLVVFLLVPATFVYFVWMIYSWRRRQAGLPESHCEKCGYDLRASFGRCPECGTPVPDSPEEESDRIARQHILDPRRLREEWPASPLAPRIPSESEGVWTVYSTRHSTEADLLKQQIEARGISCRVVDRGTLRVRRASGDPLYFALVVPEGDKQFATEIVDSFRTNPPAKSSATKTRVS